MNRFVREHEMKINVDMTKLILFNTARNYFMPSISLGNKELLVVEEFKLLGIILTSDMKWNANTAYLCEKGYNRLWMLRNLKKLGASHSELLDVYSKQ